MPDDRGSIDPTDVATLFKIILELPGLLDKKKAAFNDLDEWLQKKEEPRDTDRLLELLAENIVDDIAWIGKVRHAIGIDPTRPLVDMPVEALKLLLFTHLGLTGQSGRT